jgi:hypothetical protein
MEYMSLHYPPHYGTFGLGFSHLHMEYMSLHYPPHYGTFGLGFSHLHLHIHMFSDVFIVVRLILLMNIGLIKF